MALTSLLTASALSPLALPGSETWLLLAVQLALLAGVLQLVFGALRLAHLLTCNGTRCCTASSTPCCCR